MARQLSRATHAGLCGGLLVAVLALYNRNAPFLQRLLLFRGLEQLHGSLSSQASLLNVFSHRFWPINVYTELLASRISRAS